MSQFVLIYGRSGSGKSCSARNFKNLFIINVNGKVMPYKPLDSQVVWNCSEYDKIKQAMLNAVKKDYKSIMIDDAGYLLTNAYMEKPSSVSGNANFDFYNKLGSQFFDLLKFIRNLEENVIVYLVMHEDIDDQGYHKVKTIGRILDDKVCIEGLSTIALRSCKVNNTYAFCTNTDGLDITKSPMGMFENQYVQNDLSEVDKVIRSFYKLEENKKGNK